MVSTFVERGFDAEKLPAWLYRVSANELVFNFSFETFPVQFGSLDSLKNDA